MVGVAVAGTEAAVVEVNSRIDFVARNAEFQEIVSTIAKVAITAKGDVAARLPPLVRRRRSPSV